MNFICTIIPYIYKTYIIREKYISNPNPKPNYNHNTNTNTNTNIDTDVDIDTDIDNTNQTKIDVIVDEHQQKHTHIHSDNQTHKQSDNDLNIYTFSLAESSYKFDYISTTIKQEQLAKPISKESQTVSTYHPTSNPNCIDTKSDIDDKEDIHNLSSDIKSSTLNTLDNLDTLDTLDNEDSPDIEEITFKIYQIHCNIKTNDFLQPTLSKFISKVKEDNPLISTADNETENKATKNAINKTNTINTKNKTNKTNRSISGNVDNEDESQNPVDAIKRSDYIGHDPIKETNTKTPIQTPIQTESKSKPSTDTANKPKSAQEINATKTDPSDPTYPTITIFNFNFNFINELLGFDIYTETLKANLKKYIKHNIKLYDMFSANQSWNSNHRDINNKGRNSLKNKLKYDTVSKILDIYFICIFKDIDNTHIRYNKNNDDSKEFNDTTSCTASPLNAAVTSTEQNHNQNQNHNQECKVINKDEDINNSNRYFYTILINKALELTAIYYYTLYISADLAASDFLILNTKYTQFTKSTEDNKHKHHRYRNYNVDGNRFCDKGLNNIQHIEKSPNNPNNPNNYYKSQITGIFSRYNLENKIKIADTYNSITELAVNDGVEIDGDIKPDKQKQMQSPNYLDYFDYSDCNSKDVTDVTDVIGNLKLFLEILYLNYSNSNSSIKSEQNSNNSNSNEKRNRKNTIDYQNTLTLASIFNFLSDISFYNKEIKNSSQPSKSFKSFNPSKFLKTSDNPIANPIVSSSSVPNRYKYNHKKNDNQNHTTNTSTYTYNTSNIFNTHCTIPYNTYNESYYSHLQPFICERRLMELFFNILIFMGIDINTNINIVNKQYNYYNYYNYRDIVDKFLGDDRFKKLSDSYNPNLIKITT